jgi:hypothetical protein
MKVSQVRPVVAPSTPRGYRIIPAEPTVATGQAVQVTREGGHSRLRPSDSFSVPVLISRTTAKQSLSRKVSNVSRIDDRVWMIDSEPGTQNAMIWHNGGTGGYSSLMSIFPRLQRAVIILQSFAGRTAELERVAPEFL